MGFFDSLSRIVQGKPVFQLPTDKPAVADSPNSAETAASTSKSVPVVFIERSTCSNTTGTGIRVTANVRNSSDQIVEIDKIRLMGTSTEIDTQLRAGESREFNIFNGNRPSGSGYDDAYIVYKDMSGDYFESYHTVQYKKEADGTFSPQQFRFSGPVKDI